MHMWYCRFGEVQVGDMKVCARGVHKMEQNWPWSADMYCGRRQAADFDPRDPTRRDEARPFSAAWGRPRWWAMRRDADDGAGRDRPRTMARVEAGRGFESDMSCSECTDRGHVARVEAIRGRYQNCLIHLSFGSNPGLSGWPGSSFKPP